MTDSPVLQIQNLSKHYGEFAALDDLSLTLDRGRILGFIGPNGAGKTTTIKILVGLSKPTAGRATICGHDCSRDTRRIKRVVGYMPDVFGAYDNMRVREYLDFFGAAFKIPRKLRQQRIDACLEITGSAYMKDRYVEALSHGMKQRVAIARTMLHDPEMLILDEPANGLDPQARIEMRQILLRLAEMGKTLIVTSHILPELSRICDTVAIITHGKLRAFGTLDQIMADLRQKRLMEIEMLDDSQIDGVAEVLPQLLDPGAEVTASAAEHVIRFSSSFDNEQMARVLAKLNKAGIKVVQFREVPMDLEDAFLSVAGTGSGSGDRPAE